MLDPITAKLGIFLIAWAPYLQVCQTMHQFPERFEKFNYRHFCLRHLFYAVIKEV